MSTASDDDTIYHAGGGTRLVQGGEPVWDFGFRPSDPVHTSYVDSYDPAEDVPEIAGDKVYLWEYARHANGGKHPPYSMQITGSCFPAGTLVCLADGRERTIERIAVGDVVLAHTGAARRVTNTMSRLYTGDMIAPHVTGQRGPLWATADHPIAVWLTADVPDRLAWIAADNLRIGDALIMVGVPSEPHQVTPYGTMQRVRSVGCERVTNRPVYDLTVDVDHSFIAGGLVVHNCINSGGQNAAICRVGIEVVNLAHPEVFKLPFTLHAYGYSRHLCGWEQPGEGSQGDAMARALDEVGVTTLDDPACPKPSMYTNAFCYTAEIEKQYSAWNNCPPAVKAAAKPHPFDNYIKITSIEQAEQELRRGRPLTWAGLWGGKTKCTYQGQGADRVLWNGGKSATWSHQQSVHGLRKHHPTLGRIWYVMNNWYTIAGNVAVPVHGTPANDEPPGGYWIGDTDMEYQIRVGEVRAIRDFSGFVRGLLNFGNI